MTLTQWAGAVILGLSLGGIYIIGWRTMRHWF